MPLMFYKRYGEATTVEFSLFEVDGVDFRVDAVHAAGDSVISIDGGAEANTNSGFVDEGTGYSLALTATEMTGERMRISLIDQTATKVWLDDYIIIETYGHPQAGHPFMGSSMVHADNAQAGAASTITLATSASATDDFYNGNLVFLRDGTGAGQTGIITDYVGTTRVATINGTWATNPDTTTEYEVWVDKISIISVPTRTELNGGDYALDTDANGRMRIVDGTAAGELDTASGAVTVGTNNDKTDYTLTAAQHALIANDVLNAGQNYEQNQTANLFFVMVDSTDHVTRETGLTVSATRSIDAGDTFASATGTVTEVGNGVYRLAASAADMNGQDIAFRFTATGADPAELSVRTYVQAS